MKIKEYIREDGSNPYQKWFNRLNPVAAAKVAVAKVRLEMGNSSNIKWLGVIGEYRINWGPGYRIYLAAEGRCLIILFGGGTKRRQTADIKKARKLHQEYLERKNQEKGG